MWKGYHLSEKKKKTAYERGTFFWYIKEFGVGASTYKILLSIPLPWVEKLTSPALAAFFRVSTGVCWLCVLYTGCSSYAIGENTTVAWREKIEISYMKSVWFLEDKEVEQTKFCECTRHCSINQNSIFPYELYNETLLSTWQTIFHLVDALLYVHIHTKIYALWNYGTSCTSSVLLFNTHLVKVA